MFSGMQRLSRVRQSYGSPTVEPRSTVTRHENDHHSIRFYIVALRLRDDQHDGTDQLHVEHTNDPDSVRAPSTK
jgi:hypothetical protein